MKRALALLDPTGGRGEAALEQVVEDVRVALTAIGLGLPVDETLKLLSERTGYPGDMLEVLTQYQGQLYISADAPCVEFLETCLLHDLLMRGRRMSGSIKGEAPASL